MNLTEVDETSPINYSYNKCKNWEIQRFINCDTNTIYNVILRTDLSLQIIGYRRVYRPKFSCTTWINPIFINFGNDNKLLDGCCSQPRKNTRGYAKDQKLKRKRKLDLTRELIHMTRDLEN